MSGSRVSLYHPRRDDWATHFSVDAHSLIIEGLTETGRATIAALQSTIRCKLKRGNTGNDCYCSRSPPPYQAIGTCSLMRRTASATRSPFVSPVRVSDIRT